MIETDMPEDDTNCLNDAINDAENHTGLDGVSESKFYTVPKAKILVIDDHPFFLEGMKLGLESLNEACFEVETRSSSVEALSWLKHVRDYDLILCDLNLPEMNGLLFIKTLIKRDIWVRIAIISASENPSDITSALSAGAAGFINKSVDRNELTRALTSMLGGEQYLPSSYLKLTELNRGKKLGDTQMVGSEAAKLGITVRQYEVLTLLSKGLSNKDIADRLSVKQATIKSHLQVLFQALNVKSRTACVVAANNSKLLPESYFDEC